ncbi:MAG: sugar phosphate nucleotidyltransferase [Acidobacteriota bacterium]
MSQHIAILLCAGYGTRMGALTAETPKPLLPVAGKPMLDYLLEQLVELEGLEAIHVASNAHYAARFRDWAAGWAGRIGPEVTVHDNGSTSNDDRLGAIGDLDYVLRRIGPTAGALVAAGDNIYRFSLRPFWDAFRETGHSHVLGLEEKNVRKLRRTGVLELASDDRVVRLHEKPQQPPSTWACPSLYCLGDAALARVAGYLAEGRSSDEIGRFAAYLAERQPVFAFKTAGERLHVGSPAALAQAEEVLRQPTRA